MPPKFSRGPPRSDVQLEERATLLGRGSDDDDDDEDVIFGEAPARGGPSSARGGEGRSPAPNRANDPKMARVKGEVNEVMGIMKTNIGKVLDRGERLETLEEKSQNLQEGASRFRKGAVTLKNKMWWANMKLRIILFIIVAVIVTIIALIIYFKTKS